MNELVIKTSEENWLAKVASAYKAHTQVVIIDDAKVGIDPAKDSIFQMGGKAKMGPRDWSAVGIALGLAGMGVYLLVAAVLDPEPFSKVAFTIGAGTLLTMGGGFGAIKLLTGHRPPTVRVTARGFEVSWE